MNNQPEFEKLSEPFRALIGNEGLNYQLLDLLPIPIEIFARRYKTLPTGALQTESRLKRR